MEVVLIGVVVWTGPGGRLCGQPGAVPGGEPPGPAPRHWTSKDGLPGNHVRGLRLGPDGALWVSGDEGTARFLGDGFSAVLDPKGARLPSRSCAFDDRGVAWIERLYGITCVGPDGEDPGLPLTELLPASFVPYLAQAADQTVWLMSPGKLMRSRSGKVEPASLPHIPGLFVHALEPRNSGAGVMIGSNDGAVWTCGPSGWTGVTDPLPICDPLLLNLLFQDRRGVIWQAYMVRQSCGLAVWKDAQWQLLHDRLNPAWGAIYCLAEDRRGQLLAGTSRGYLLEFARPDLPPTVRSIAPGNPIEAIAVDDRDNRWIGSSRGLFHLTAPAGVVLTPPSPVRCRSVMMDASGRVIVGSSGAGLLELRDGRLQSLTPPGWSATPPQIIYFLLPTRSGVWLGRDYGLVQLRSGDLGLMKDHSELFPQASASVATEDGHGNVWVGDSLGRVRRFPRGETPPEKVFDQRGVVITGLATLGDSVLMSTDAGLFRWRGTNWSREAALGEGLRSLHVDGRGRAYIGTDAGLWIVTPQRKVFLGPTNGLTVSAVQQMAQDRDGNLWLGTLNGIVRIQAADVDRALADPSRPVHVSVYDESVGVPRVTCSPTGYQSALERSDRRVAFAAEEGLLVLDRDAAQESSRRAHIRLASLEVDGKWLQLRRSQPVRLHRPRHLHLNYELVAVESFGRAPYRYSTDSDRGRWITGGPERSFIWVDPSPGRHRVEFQTLDERGGWHVASTLTLDIEPHWWERLSVKIGAMALTVCGTVFFLSWFQARREAARETQRAIEARVQQERSRIARDLHDDLGNRLSEIQFLSERIGGTSVSGDRLPVLTERLSRSAQSSVAALDDLVWLLNTRNDRWGPLVQRLRLEVVQYLETAGIRGEFASFGDESMPIEPAIRHSLLLTLKELLHNAATHGRARRIDVEACVDSTRVAIVVRDDGSGFEWNQALAADRGLAGILARAREHQGALDHLRRDGWTILEFCLPRTAGGRPIEPRTPTTPRG